MNILPTTVPAVPETNLYRTPTFNVLDEGKRIDTLEHCFIEHMLLFCPDPPASLRAKNGATYTAVYDNLILPTKEQSATIKVIVSFQKHSYGMFAIVRNFKPKAINAPINAPIDTEVEGN